MPSHSTTGPDREAADPHRWLEEVEGARALAWVEARNAESQARLADSGFAALRDDLLAILEADDRIPFVVKRGAHYYNFWQDKDHPRGLWRRITPAEYRQPQPAWEVLLDLDALNAAEGENWVWHGAHCLKPRDPDAPWRHCLIALSRGGADADVTREFDLVEKRWVDDGFFRAEAKGGLAWIDHDSVYAYTDFGEGSLTASGYPRLVKAWRRATPLAEATTVFEGNADDMVVGAMRDHTRGYERDFVSRARAFYDNELYLREPDGTLRKVEAPNSARKQVHRRWLTLELREPWTLDDTTHPAGALLAADFNAFMAGERDFRVLFTPTECTSLADATWTRHHLVLNVLDDVRNRLLVLTPGDGEWSCEPLAGAPELGTVSLSAVDDEESDEVFMVVSDYLTPTTLYHGRVGEVPQPLKQAPALFDATGLTVSQHFATSRDGTPVPYFLVGREGVEANGANPTLLYGYGGFEISLLPSYSPGVGRGWLSRGGVYVVANIRGGGEYGPRWHQAALREHRHKAFEDFAAVAEDLIARGITSPRHLGIQGGSNGGLLVGNMLVKYPRLFGAVVCQVPLLDMRRYHELLAGASWMAEYGDPDGDDWAFLRGYSPYHNLDAAADYPPLLLMTSTRDDRVHPGHARKMMARMREQGHPVLYYENIEGGHGGAADNRQRAHMQALAYTFLEQTLFAGG
ncbi:prolyl oligopeptidase family serine peptidase [Halomonas heilongjiangensis]|uniref:S9 family peptidase n=1 Tax=Halomonas heilongjiangensis TaxID=1387883 RepID=A0A2N7TIT9_9GAMM|nr:prolyl oligopeptidase family serine peptidase [Halomonas heilongjiangensis]PMR68096.1 S9 family peptidase [Halomonas heilongjiangensis]PXX92152.1 S9 family peptidase [Halomonas heilongjiangensis]